MSQVAPFSLTITPAALEDLRARLRRVRWPDAETVNDWRQGVPAEYLQSFCHYWLNGYDLNRVQDQLNSLPQFKTVINDVEIYFIHVKSSQADATPLIMTHGWPGSVIEFLKVIKPLTEPGTDASLAAPAFDVVIPALPGFGLSGKPTTTGWGVEKIARSWNELMQRLGYERYYAQGGDWGAAVTSEIGRQNLGQCKAIHVNMPTAWPTNAARQNPTAADEAAFKGARFYRDWDSGYSHQQATRPQSIGYSLSDSPVAQAAWILEKFYAWTDCDGHPENVLTKDELLDNIMLYWLTNTAASSARLYWESFGQNIKGEENQIHLPTGCSIFPKEIVPTPREWAAQRYKNIVYWRYLDKGGHFAAFEQPELFVTEMRDWFKVVSNL